MCILSQKYCVPRNLAKTHSLTKALHSPEKLSVQLQKKCILSQKALRSLKKLCLFAKAPKHFFDRTCDKITQLNTNTLEC